jgi:hypothetical protein
MSDIKASAPAATRSLVVEVAAGTGEPGHDDGPLDKCTFRFPYALCAFDGTLFVADHDAVRAVDGLLGADWSSVKGIGTVSELEASLTAALLTAIPALPKELARVTAQYARPTGVRLVAGSYEDVGDSDGHAVRNALFNGPTGMAIDTFDPEAGPQLIISDHAHGLRCLNLRTDTVTTLVGRPPQKKTRSQVFNGPYGVAVAPNGVVFVAVMLSGCVRRIGRRDANGSTADHPITTVVGQLDTTRLAPFAPVSFQKELKNPHALCLIPIAPPDDADRAERRRTQCACLLAVRMECIRSICLAPSANTFRSPAV